MYKQINVKNKVGFTLVEMLVSIAVFMSVMVVAMTALISIININKQTQQIKSVVDNVTFALDSIARSARVGTNYSCKINYTDGGYVGDCPNPDTNTYPQGGKGFEFTNPDGTVSQYRFIASSDPILTVGQGNIQRCNKQSCTIADTAWQSLTAPTSTVNITNMTFYVLGTTHQSDVTQSTRTQPRVIITVEGDIISKGKTTPFMVQTSASQRTRKTIN